jgi:Ca2+-transporting ATPase
VPSLLARLQGKKTEISYAPLVGVGCILILQAIFSQWSVINQLFDTVPLSFRQALTCIGVALPVVLVAAIVQFFEPKNPRSLARQEVRGKRQNTSNIKSD